MNATLETSIRRKSFLFYERIAALVLQLICLQCYLYKVVS